MPGPPNWSILINLSPSPSRRFLLLLFFPCTVLTRSSLTYELQLAKALACVTVSLDLKWMNFNAARTFVCVHARVRAFWTRTKLSVQSSRLWPMGYLCNYFVFVCLSFSFGWRFSWTFMVYLIWSQQKMMMKWWRSVGDDMMMNGWQCEVLMKWWWWWRFLPN